MPKEVFKYLFVAPALARCGSTLADEYKIPNLFKKLGILTVKVRTQRGLP
jgi:hypothetical protein